MIKPLADYVLIQPEVKKEHTTDSGIILTVDGPKGPQKGKIVAVNENSDMAVGDTVLYKEWVGFEITDSGEKYLLIAEEDVLVRLEDSE